MLERNGENMNNFRGWTKQTGNNSLTLGFLIFQLLRKAATSFLSRDHSFTLLKQLTAGISECVLLMMPESLKYTSISMFIKYIGEEIHWSVGFHAK